MFFGLHSEAFHRVDSTLYTLHLQLQASGGKTLSVRIRLKRMGKKKMPFYRVVVADIKSPRDGRFIENIGTYDPHKDPVEINIEEEKALYWLSKGATPSDTVRSLLSKIGVMKKFDQERSSSTGASE